MKDSTQLISIPAGAFRMGAHNGGKNEQPVRSVSVDAFSIAATPVTRDQYARFIEATGHTPPDSWTDPRFTDPQQPVVSVTWFDATAYCEWLSEQIEGSVRLPTEAEREKAARGGAEGLDYPWGNDLRIGWIHIIGATTLSDPTGWARILRMASDCTTWAISCTNGAATGMTRSTTPTHPRPTPRARRRECVDHPGEDRGVTRSR